MDSSSLKKKLGNIRLIAMDVDGVLSDGRIFFDSHGVELKSFNTHDGYGIARGISHGVRFAVITGRNSPMVARRAAELGIKELHQGVDDKLAVYTKIKKRYRLEDREICYIGDDEPDLPVLERAGLSAAPADALPEIRRRVDFVSRNKGGRGAVREVIDAILRARKLI